jgi:hypothetical protein
MVTKIYYLNCSEGYQLIKRIEYLKENGNFVALKELCKSQGLSCNIVSPFIHCNKSPSYSLKSKIF